MYTDTLIRIKNSLMRKNDRAKVPYSKTDLAILESLVKHDYLEEASRKGKGVRRIIDIKLKYDKDKSPAISGIKFISTPSRRIYVGWQDIKRSKQGYGNFFISTSQGIMVDYEAKKRRLGGELLFEIW